MDSEANDNIDFVQMDYNMECEDLIWSYGLTRVEAMNILDFLYPDGEVR